MTPTRVATRTASGPIRGSLWRQIAAQYGPGAAAARYAALVRHRARQADPATFAGSAREDSARLATAVGAVIDLHTPTARGRCRACSIGPHLVDWPCATRQALDDGIRHGWSPVCAAAEPPAPDPHEGFALAVLATHDILPAVGGHPAVCRACHTPPGECPVWALAEGFLGITWTDSETTR